MNKTQKTIAFVVRFVYGVTALLNRKSGRVRFVEFVRFTFRRGA